MASEAERRIQVPVSVAAWNRERPEVSAARPARCPACQRASRPAGDRLILVGHGLRSLLLLGPVQFGGSQKMVEIDARRYRCRACRAVCMVVPQGVGSGRRYFMPAIALALGLWSLELLPAARIRSALSPFGIVGSSSTGWRSLRRWARAYGKGDGTLREQATRFAQGLLATSPLSAQTHQIQPRIFAAALHQSRWPSP